MKKEVLQLNGQWEFKEFPETARRMRDLEDHGWMDASVPSSIFSCLMDADVINREEFTASPEKCQWVSDRSWIFRKQFDAPASIIEKEQIQLVFEGLDTVAHIWLNGKLIGKTENMFTPHSFDVTEYIKPSGNIIHVKFLPALLHAERLTQRYGKLSEHHYGDARRCYLRKAQYQFGSAMAPPLVGCGIFRSVRLQGSNIAQLNNVHIRTVDCNQHRADIRIAVSLGRIKETKTALQCRFEITGGGLKLSETLDLAAHEDHHAILLQIDRPILWWPHGCGVQHQYHLEARLFQDQQLLDSVETNFGIRTIHLNRNADKHGHAFQFEVNGQPVKIKGANWMPPTVLPGEKSDNDYADSLKQAANAHVNMLRVWGGGMYEDPAFYDVCDQLGIMVWQDFMFATAYYPDRQWFSDIVQKEARDVIVQLRNHPSLALWCGNSRIDSLHETGRLGAGRKFFGKAIYHSLLPGLLSELDPDRDYISTTPFSEPPENDHNDPRSGTTHAWNIWDHYIGKNKYRSSGNSTPRFVSEFGLQSAPDLLTVSQFGLESGLTSSSFSFEKHNYQPGGQSRIARYIADQFAPTESLTEYIRHSQLAQARAVKHFVEHLRCRSDINSGCLLWTWNDPLPSISFSAVDANGHPKAMYYYAKRFFAPILIALQRTDEKSPYTVTAVNDSLMRITATLRCRMMNFTGTILDEMEIPVALSPGRTSNAYPLAKSFAQLDNSKTAFLHLSLMSDEGTLAVNTYFFAPDKYLRYRQNTIDMEVSQHPSKKNSWRIKLCSEIPARDVQLIAPLPARLSDNFFTLLPGQNKEVTMEFRNSPPCGPVPIEVLTAGSCR